jgi:hypothetical protein
LVSIAAFVVVLLLSSWLIMTLNLNYHDGWTVGGAFFVALAVSGATFFFSMKKTRKEKNLHA